MKAHAGAQVKDERQRIGLLPSLRKRRRQLKMGISFHETVEDQSIDALRLSISADARIEIGRAALDEDDHGVGIARSGAAGRECDKREHK
jgi:hypothetical protein